FACGAVACLGLDAQPAEIAAALQGGGARLAVPPSSRWRFAGAPGRWCSGTDLILHALAALGAEAARGSAVELCGPALERLFLVERLAMSVLAGHGGAAAAFCYPDEAALAWLRARSTRTLKPLLPDSGAAYRDARDIDVDDLEPMAAPARALCTGRRLSELPEIPLDQVVIGGGSGGRIEDLRLVARLLKEHGVHAGVRLLVIPGNQRAFQHAVDEGCAASLLRCGALVAAPTCGLWDDPQLTTLGGAERCLATSVAGCPAASLAPQAEVYVASPAVAAASAVLGRIAHPDEVLRSRREAV
ncbi:MAG: hypothetical protein HY812_20890, partial [Planctomycetes bacterium]|nr:hypothetical protein [Planctomycetota bacterium]